MRNGGGVDVSGSGLERRDLSGEWNEETCAEWNEIYRKCESIKTGFELGEFEEFEKKVLILEFMTDRQSI